jgi:PAS domain S-box-containing protein
MELYHPVIVGLVVLVLAQSLFMLSYQLRNKKTLNELKVMLDIGRSEQQKISDLLEKKDKEILVLDKLARLVKQSPNGIMLMDADGNVLSINKGFENMYEYNYDEFIKACGSNYHKTSFDPKKVQERLDIIARTRKPVRYEALNITKSGKELWTQTALMPILDDKNVIIGLVTIDTDIHKRVVESDNLVSKMEEINTKVDYMAKQFKVLISETKSLFDSINESKQLIEQTDQIIKFIKEISDKTKILGINASIEANIAGMQGRGFRVVANEIVDISNKTIQSVGEIGKILTSVSNKQEELIIEKSNSEETINEHQKLIKALKKEIKEVEDAIADFKSLT